MKTISIYDNRKTVEEYIKSLNLCKEEYLLFVNSATQAEWVGRLCKNYVWLRIEGVIISEIDELSKAKFSKYFVWLLETYCLGKGVDKVVQPVIELHKRVIGGEGVKESAWADARAASLADSSSRASWVAFWVASASADAINKIGEIILEK